ncbi:3-keto-disaccharide hydrolase [Rufibacter immobilis]|uniref:3-keto-disaccharide hydrolase n=1 Tax=Rufibacter immobilis TaxID=1348778 RepID=UPI0035E5B115
MAFRNLLPVLSLAALVACQTSSSPSMDSTASSLAPAGKEGKWQPLFDGKTTQGWHTYGQQTIGKAWKVEDGTLRLDAAAKKDWQTSEGGDIVTQESFGDFHLKLDWKIAANGNSGIILFVQEDPAQYKYTWHTGPEIQVLDNAGHPDAKIHKHRAGDLYDLIASSPETVKPAGEWNQVEIISQNGRLEVKQNGQQVLSTTMWDDNWRALIAGSKFAKMPGFGAFKSGKIALQDHGDNVWYRNIMIKRL